MSMFKRRNITELGELANRDGADISLQHVQDVLQPKACVATWENESNNASPPSRYRGTSLPDILCPSSPRRDVKFDST